MLLVFCDLTLGWCDLSNRTPDLKKSLGANLIAPVQRNGFAIMEFGGNREYTIFMVAWLSP